MFKFRIVFLLILLGCILPLTGFAGEYDGSKPMLCAIIDVYECTIENACQPLKPSDLMIPRFLHIDVKKKVITGKLEDGTLRSVDINVISHEVENLILQGNQSGRAWSMVIQEETGKTTFNVSEKGVSVVCFGESIIP
jgi:hypothetical protein